MARLWKVAEARGADREHLMHLEESGLRNLQVGYLAKIESVKQEVAMQAAKIGSQQAQANAGAAMAELDQKAADLQTQIAQSTHIQAMTHTRKSLEHVGVQTKKLPNGQVVWKNPGDGLWYDLLRPTPRLAPMPAAAPAPAPAAPPTPVQGGGQ